MAHEPDPADLLRDAHFLREAAAKDRARARKLAVRFARRVREKWSAVRADLLARRAELDEARGQLTAEAMRFQQARSDYAGRATEESQRLRQEWDALDAQRQRLHAEWTEMQATVGRQEAAVAQREAELAAREKELARGRNELAAQAAAVRGEAAGLAARAENARAVVAELEARRDKLHAELLAAAPKVNPDPPGTVKFALSRSADQDLADFSAALDAEALRLGAERAALTELRARLDREAVDAEDQRRVLAEQFVLLAQARGGWQEAERRALADLEDLTRALRQKEAESAARDEWLVRSDARRREEGYDLWQLRLRLEAWQSKLVATERRWHAEREARDAEYARRLHALLEREHGGELVDDELPVADEARVVPSEGTTLRDEFERLAAVLIKADLPEPPDSQLPWGGEESDEPPPTILPFPDRRAA
ncbi:coiled-coil domain-containing protein [Urbifossiella limnaea]|uniref:Chromosome partition protein Smc n=1 Tax=Urbifossiella limnaea TaxID=2528023 RepID=A0A517XYD1_9BACT|nr:hypothetical protein [Urbifossiella limnaea]QDU22526.1 Chromosome partition protein Smc [Urbifossiella limnaea]